MQCIYMSIDCIWAVYTLNIHCLSIDCMWVVYTLHLHCLSIDCIWAVYILHIHCMSMDCIWAVYTLCRHCMSIDCIWAVYTVYTLCRHCMSIDFIWAVYTQFRHCMSIDCMWAVYTDIQSIYSPKDKNLLAGQGARGLEALAALQLFLTPRGGCSGTQGRGAGAIWCTDARHDPCRAPCRVASPAEAILRCISAGEC